MRTALTLFLAISSGAAIAQSKPKPQPKPAKPKTEIHCAVMTKSVINIKEATKFRMYQDYKGRRYFFCCEECPRSFAANPAKYAKNESLPVPKKKRQS